MSFLNTFNDICGELPKIFEEEYVYYKNTQCLKLDGVLLSKKIQEKIGQIKLFDKPKLAILLAGKHPPSELYVNNKIKLFNKLKLATDLYRFDKESHSLADVEKRITSLNNDKSVHGIIVQLPLPSGYDTEKIINLIDPKKDVDGFTDKNMGALLNFKFNQCFIPCTAYGIIFLLKSYGVSLSGKNILIINRTRVVGKPLIPLFLSEDGTVTMAHSKTKGLKKKCLDSDIIVSASGNPHLIEESFVKEDAILLDVGIAFDKKNKKIHGDIHPDVACKAHMLSPVPGGVGPMTVCMLALNTILASKIYK